MLLYNAGQWNQANLPQRRKPSILKVAQPCRHPGEHVGLINCFDTASIKLGHNKMHTGIVQ